jgi:hypothetical protein
MLSLYLAHLRNDCYGVTDTSPINKKNSVTLVREQTVPTELPPLVGEDNAKFYG